MVEPRREFAHGMPARETAASNTAMVHYRPADTVTTLRLRTFSVAFGLGTNARNHVLSHHRLASGWRIHDQHTAYAAHGIEFRKFVRYVVVFGVWIFVSRTGHVQPDTRFGLSVSDAALFRNLCIAGTERATAFLLLVELCGTALFPAVAHTERTQSETGTTSFQIHSIERHEQSV